MISSNETQKGRMNMKKIAISTALCLLMQTCYLLSACASYEDNLGTIDLTAMTVTGAGIAVTDNTISITEGGEDSPHTYHTEPLTTVGRCPKGAKLKQTCGHHRTPSRHEDASCRNNDGYESI